MPHDTRIAVLFLLPFWARRPPEDVGFERRLELRRFAEDLHSEGIWLIPFPLELRAARRFFPYYIDEFEWLLERASIDWSDLDYLWHRAERYWPEQEEMWWRYYRERLPEVLHFLPRLIEERLVSGVVIPTLTGLEEQREHYEFQRISELFPPRSVLYLEIAPPERKERPSFPGIRLLRYPENRDEIVEALRSFPPSRRRAPAPAAAAAPASAYPEPPAYPEPRGKAAPPVFPKQDAAAGAAREAPAAAPKEAETLPAKPVHLGASAPTRVRPGDEFTARFSAYHPAFAKVAKKALRQPNAKSYPDQIQTSWKLGEEVRVVLVGEHMTASPLEQKFTWDGKHKTVQFDVTVDNNVPEKKRILLRFDVYIQDAVVARVRLPLTIGSTSGFLQRLFVPEQQSFMGEAPQTAYASFEVADKADVMSRVDAIAQHAGIRFFTECLSLDPNKRRQGALQKAIAEQDLFMLFWSWAAAKSPAVTWEWLTALKRPGREHMEAQRLKPSDPEPVLPPELQSLGMPKGRPSRMQHTNIRFFVVGCVLSIFVAGLVIWAFALGTLTPDQRTLIRVLISLFSGFAAGSFVGAFTVKAQGLVPGVVATATGGFGVWLLTAFVMLPAASTFDIVVQPHGPASVLDTFKKGTVSLQVGDQLKRRSIDEDGQARFLDISGKFRGERVPVGVQVSGFRMKYPDQQVELQQGEAVAVPMISESP